MSFNPKRDYKRFYRQHHELSEKQASWAAVAIAETTFSVAWLIAPADATNPMPDIQAGVKTTSRLEKKDHGGSHVTPDGKS